MRSFLRLPHARAALMEGGLVWRLVREIVGNQLDEEALYGPSQCVQQFGIHFVERRNLWDDHLTETEFDFILGMNKTYTGKCLASLLSPLADFSAGVGDQLVELSWWPKHSTFKKSGLYLGYWSEQCEDWFQRRLADIRSSKGRQKSAKKWASDLKFHNKTPKIVACAQDLAAKHIKVFHLRY